MEILIAILASYIPTKIVKFIYKYKLINDLAERGMKLKDYYGFNKSRVKDLVPVVNILFSLNQHRKYKNNKDEIIEELNKNGALIELNDKEQEACKREDLEFVPLLINAEGVEKLRKKDVEIKNSIEVDVDNIIFYQINPTTEESRYKIVSTKGEVIKSLTEEEQISIIEEYYNFISRKIKEYIEEKYDGNEEDFQQDISLNNFDFTSYKTNLTKEFQSDLANKLLKK